MPRYRVVVRATVTQTFELDAPNSDGAADKADDLFTIDEPANVEQFDQGVISVDEIAKTEGDTNA